MQLKSSIKIKHIDDQLYFVKILFYILVTVQTLVLYLILLPYYLFYEVLAFFGLTILLTLNLLFLLMYYMRCERLEPMIVVRSYFWCDICKIKITQTYLHSYRLNKCIGPDNLNNYMKFSIFYAGHHVYGIIIGFYLVILYCGHRQDFYLYDNDKLLVSHRLYFPLIVFLETIYCMVMLIVAIVRIYKYRQLLFLNPRKVDQTVLPSNEIIPAQISLRPTSYGYHSMNSQMQEPNLV